MDTMDNLPANTGVAIGAMLLSIPIPETPALCYVPASNSMEWIDYCKAAMPILDLARACMLVNKEWSVAVCNIAPMLCTSLARPAEYSRGVNAMANLSPGMIGWVASYTLGLSLPNGKLHGDNKHVRICTHQTADKLMIQIKTITTSGTYFLNQPRGILKQSVDVVTDKTTLTPDGDYPAIHEVISKKGAKEKSYPAQHGDGLYVCDAFEITNGKKILSSRKVCRYYHPETPRDAMIVVWRAGDTEHTSCFELITVRDAQHDWRRDKSRYEKKIVTLEELIADPALADHMTKITELL